jgi:hypothetical protein
MLWILMVQTTIHPLLSWGTTKYAPFRKKLPIEDGQLEFPLKIVFQHYNPQKCEMADLLQLDAIYAVSEKFKKMFEREKVNDVQFLPIEIECDNNKPIEGYYAMHLWKRIPAIDKNNYKGGKPDMLGLIMDLQSFSLDEEVLNNISVEQRKVIRLSEDPTMILVHQSFYEAIISERLTGMVFFRVNQWNTGSVFRI